MELERPALLILNTPRKFRQFPTRPCVVQAGRGAADGPGQEQQHGAGQAQAGALLG
jgi:hypothetical protein